MSKPTAMPVPAAQAPSRLASLGRMIQLIRHDRTASGDIVLHKADVFLGTISAHQREALANVEPLIPSIDMDALRALPEASFGRAYAEFLDANGLHPFTVSAQMPEAIVTRNAHWSRYALMHDMFHVLLGYGPDLPGEIGVYAFSLAQRTSWMFWTYLPLAAVVVPLLAPHRIPRMIRNFRRGFRLGRRLDNMLALQLERRFAAPLDELRAELGLRTA